MGATDAELRKALRNLRGEFADMKPADGPPTLLHQDLNDGNVLCSATGSEGKWKLDALIDFESAAVGDSRLVYCREPLWQTLRAFGHAVKGQWLAKSIVEGSAPRCEAGELAENHDRARKFLAKQGR